jgi:hypothetical protein
MTAVPAVEVVPALPLVEMTPVPPEACPPALTGNGASSPQAAAPSTTGIRKKQVVIGNDSERRGNFMGGSPFGS